jgi:hypothetical protein
VISRQTTESWWLPLLAGAALALLALYPQFDLKIDRGHAWNGSYAYVDTDEVAYAAYVNALRDGRPRRNDPYTGRDDFEGKTQPESLFSIQFLPAYGTLLLSWLPGIDIARAFVMLMGVGAVTTTLACYWLLRILTGDVRFSSAGALIILALGTLASGQGAIRYLFGAEAAYNYLPFLRRYIPLLPFPLFFLFCALIWLSLRAPQPRKKLVLAFAAGLVFAATVYSYFFLWTAELAWLGCLIIALLIFRRAEWAGQLKALAVTIAVAVVSLMPYAWLLLHRSEAMDSAQLLMISHKPDLFRVPELLGFAAACILIASGRLRRRPTPELRSIVIFAFCFLPFALFNQQIVTGRTLQPIHYEQFIGNYVSLLALLLSVYVYRSRAEDLRPAFKPFHLAFVATAAFGWGVIETSVTTQIYRPYNLLRDEGWAVCKRLRELYPEDLRRGRPSPVVLSTSDLLADDIPSATPDAVLWARHMHVFAGVDLAENKRRFYQLLYYTGVKEDEVREGLENHDFYYTVALFGWDRANFNLTAEPKPLTSTEIDEEIARLSEFMSSFDRTHAGEPQLSYLVTRADEEPGFDNIDKWYERDAGENVGEFRLYKLRRRQ